MEYSIASPDLLRITSPSPLRHQDRSAIPFLPSTRAWQIHCAVVVVRMFTMPTFLLVPIKAIHRPQGESLKRSQERWSVVLLLDDDVFWTGAMRRVERVILPVVKDQFKK